MSSLFTHCPILYCFWIPQDESNIYLDLLIELKAEINIFLTQLGDLWAFFSRTYFTTTAMDGEKMSEEENPRQQCATFLSLLSASYFSSENFFNLLLLNINWKIVMQVLLFSSLRSCHFLLSLSFSLVVNNLFNSILCLTLKLDLFLPFIAWLFIWWWLRIK